jgi:hypothetical protein
VFRYVKEAEDSGLEYQRHTGVHTGGDKIKRQPEDLQDSK